MILDLLRAGADIGEADKNGVTPLHHAVRFRGLLLSGMCVPDVRGSQGTFSFFSTETREGKAAFTGGEQTVLVRRAMSPDWSR